MLTNCRGCYKVRCHPELCSLAFEHSTLRPFTQWVFSIPKRMRSRRTTVPTIPLLTPSIRRPSPEATLLQIAYALRASRRVSSVHWTGRKQIAASLEALRTGSCMTKHMGTQHLGAAVLNEAAPCRRKPGGSLTGVHQECTAPTSCQGAQSGFTVVWFCLLVPHRFVTSIAAVAVDAPPHGGLPSYRHVSKTLVVREERTAADV